MGISKDKLASALLFLVSLLIFCLPAAALARARQVVFIRYRIPPGYFANVVAEFKAGMSQRGFTEGKDIEYIDILTRSADNDSIPDVLAAVRQYKDSADMFITCGWVSMPARELLKETGVPQLFVPVLKSVALEMLPSVKNPPGTNLSGIYLMYPPEKILRLARLILPRARKYAYVYDSLIPADRLFKKEYEELAPADRHDFSLAFLDLAAGEEKVIAELRAQGIDVYGGIVGFFHHRQALAASGIPLITSFTLDIDQQSIREHVGDDTIAGLFNPFGFCGAEAAAMTADIFEGRRTIADSTPRPAKQLAFINLKAARQRNLPISFDALEAVDIIVK
jgi:putative ABC transport system substrate-binding protein